MDSIMKNHKYTTNYNEIFETRILELFTHVFESVSFSFLFLKKREFSFSFNHSSVIKINNNNNKIFKREN